jgi:hypothetical protein
MKITKTAQILSGVALLLVGLSCGLAILLAILPSGGLFDILGVNPNQRVNVVFSLALWAFTLPIVFMEYGIFWINKSRKMGDSEGSYPLGNVWTKIARALLLIGLVVSMAVILASLFLLAVEILIFGIVLFRDPASLIQPLLTAGLLLLVYLPIRISLWVLWRLVGKKAATQISLGLAKYNLIDRGVEIDLNFVIQIGAPGPSRFFVRFDELEEARSLTYVETVSYLNYTVGPNIELGLREKRELYEWRTGKIPRPTVYLSNAESMFGKKVLLRGPGLFYLISFHSNDVSDLIDAFHRYGPISSLPAPTGSAAIGSGL